MNHDIHTTRLIGSCSTDQTRYHLNGIFVDDEYLVSTDGHRLYTVKRDQVFPLKGIQTNKIYCAKAWKVEAASEIEGSYPAWRMLIPDIKEHLALKVTIPHWFANIKRERSRDGTPDIRLTKDGHFTTAPKSDDILTCFNMFYMREFAGLEVVLHVKDAISSILVTETVKSFKEQDWAAVVMPMRM